MARNITIIDGENRLELELNESANTISASGKSVCLLNQGVPLAGGLWLKCLVTRKPKSGDIVRES